MYGKLIEQHSFADKVAWRLRSIPGVSPVTASAMQSSSRADETSPPGLGSHLTTDPAGKGTPRADKKVGRRLHPAAARHWHDIETNQGAFQPRGGRSVDPEHP